MPLGLSGIGRFSEPALLIMMSLAAGNKHGYAILNDVENTFGVRLGPGTLYSTIERLEERRLIAALPAESRRRPYELTPAGVRELHTQLANMEQFVITGQRRVAEL
jgi:DNA-binding PadR family transcriptional regulator